MTGPARLPALLDFARVSSLLTRAVFAVLVLATAGAFAATQALKRSEPVVKRVFFHKFLSPDGDGHKDTARLRFDLPRRDSVTVSIVDERGREVRRLAGRRELGAGTHSFVWDGRTDAGEVAADGRYRLRVVLHREGRGLTAGRSLVVLTKPPRPKLIAVTPHEIAPGARGPWGRARIRFEGRSDPAPVFRIYRTDRGRPREVARFRGTRFRRTAFWDGRIGGKPAPDGVYAVSVTVRNRALVAGSAPTRLPPERARTRPRTGISVAGVSIEGPVEPVRAGALARFKVGPAPRPVRWRLTPFDSGKRIADGRAAGRRLEYRDTEAGRAGMRVGVRVPRDTTTGLYLLRVEVAGHSGVAPLAVQGRPRGLPRESRVLVVLPAVAWQGQTPVDDDDDGFPDTLDSSRSVRLARPLAYARLPHGFRENVGPLLRFLGRERYRYELTTDVALARFGKQQLRRYVGILFPGPERWTPPRMDRALRRYVELGGRVAIFGPDSFRRSVKIAGAALRDPVAARKLNAFGEWLSPLDSPPAPLVVFSDRMQLFRSTDGLFGQFERFEQSRELAAPARLRAAAGREREHPAFVAYGLGFGLVVRVGVPAWSTQLGERDQSIEVVGVTRRVLRLLAR